MTLHSGFGTPETSREHLLSEMIIHIGYVPGIFFYAKVFETTRYIYLIYLIYRTRAIITRGLYIFYPIFEGQKRFFKELFL